MLKIKRVYDSAQTDDGVRVLVDRLWPRGLTKIDAQLDRWAKILAPSNELRTRFNHRQDRFDEFKKRYLEELRHNLEAQVEIERIISQCKEQTVTLLYAAKEIHLNQAVVLKEYIDSLMEYKI